MVARADRRRLKGNFLFPKEYARASELNSNPIGWSSFHPPQDARVGVPRGDLLSFEDVRVNNLRKQTELIMAFAGGIGGVNAKLANRGLLKEAQEYKRAGLSDKKVEKHTGWWQDKDDNWLFEIPSHNMKLRTHVLESAKQARDGPSSFVESKGKLYPNFWDGSRVEDVIDHPELFANYPGLGRMSIKEIPRNQPVMGVFRPQMAEIGISVLPPLTVKQTLAHELTHGVQALENMPNGGSQRQFLPKDFNLQQRMMEYDIQQLGPRLEARNLSFSQMSYMMQNPSGKDLAFLGKLASEDPDLFDSLKKATGNVATMKEIQTRAYNSYLSLVGEQTAEAVAKRVELTPQQTRNQLFTDAFDMPYENMLMGKPVDYHAIPQRSSK